jgi:hypothetical protein
MRKIILMPNLSHSTKVEEGSLANLKLFFFFLSFDFLYLLILGVEVIVAPDHTH